MQDIDLQSHIVAHAGQEASKMHQKLGERKGESCNKIKQCGKKRRKEEASRAASTGATGVYLEQCISDLESDAII